MTGPSEWFTGAVYVDPVAEPSADSDVSASTVHFTPGARTSPMRSTSSNLRDDTTRVATVALSLSSGQAAAAVRPRRRG
jgi:hypothetical protein